MKIILALAALLLVATPALSCPAETEEGRILEILTPDDTYFIIEGADLDLFVKNSNEVYNIGWIRETILKVYVIDAEFKSENPNFQVVHLFFISPDGCIAYYQTTYKAVVRLMLDPEVFTHLGIER